MLEHKYETFLFLTLHFVIYLALQTKPGNGLSHVPCPRSCICLLDQTSVTQSWSLSCLWQPHRKDRWKDVSTFVSRESNINQLSFHGGLLDVPDFSQNFHSVRLLKLDDNNLIALNSRAFDGLQSLIYLGLSFNSITVIEAGAFGGLHHLQNLNLSHNKLKNLPVQVLQPMPLLKIVNLGSNLLEIIPQDVFHVIASVEEIDLSFNRLSYLTSVHFSKLKQLKHLDLSGNRFRMFHEDFVKVFHNVPSLDLSGNPFDCSCAVQALRKTIDQLSISNHSMMMKKIHKPGPTYSSNHFINLDKYMCRTPYSIAGELLLALNTAKLSCATPIITDITKDKEVLTSLDLHLTCVAFGYPSPAIVWKTPWGNSYTHRSHFPLLGDVAIQIQTSQTYEYMAFMKPSLITVSENGTLHISKFRGYFAGNYTCVGIGPSGNDSSYVFVGITNQILNVYNESLLMCVYATGAFFVVCCIIGLLIMLIKASRRKCRAVEEKVISFAETESKAKFSEVCGFTDDDDNNSCAPASVPSSVSLTPEMEKKSITSEDINPSGWIPVNIFETLDEARSRLSIGVGRKMEKVRSQVQSIKESGTVYVHNFKTTSSVAANRVRAGMVLGVETIKYSAQSIREFCWVGDMSGQTISMISVSTDVDTEKQTEVIHTVTFV